MLWLLTYSHEFLMQGTPTVPPPAYDHLESTAPDNADGGVYDLVTTGLDTDDDSAPGDPDDVASGEGFRRERLGWWPQYKIKRHLFEVIVCLN